MLGSHRIWVTHFLLRKSEMLGAWFFLRKTLRTFRMPNRSEMWFESISADVTLWWDNADGYWLMGIKVLKRVAYASLKSMRFKCIKTHIHTILSINNSEYPNVVVTNKTWYSVTLKKDLHEAYPLTQYLEMKKMGEQLLIIGFWWLLSSILLIRKVTEFR